ncbi:MAG: hypothetical protein FJ279_02025 [Planctomycetes bacterium]|nr:hypothetical protein [Planctomycetota bacterium]
MVSKCCLPAVLVVAASLHTLAELPPVGGDKALFVISDEVVVKDPPRFGANIHPPQMNHWATEPWHNQWWLQPNPNPFYAQTKGWATGGGADYIEDLTAKQGSKTWGIGFYDVFRDGFFNGGTATVYRYENGKMTWLREGRIRSYKASVDGENRAWFDAPGPAVKAGDMYVLTVERTDIPAGTTRTMENFANVLSGYRILDGSQMKSFKELGGRMEIDRDAPPGGGAGSLKVTVPASSQPVRVGYWLISGQKADWPRFKEGKTYVCSLWLKQRGMATGAVEVRVALMGSQKFNVGSAWKQYSFEFAGAPPKQSGAEPFDIGASEPGTLWIDNVSIHEKDTVPPFALYPQVVLTLKEFRPNTLRLWALQENRGFGRLLDDALGPVFESRTEFTEIQGAKTPDSIGLHQQLELCAEVGADPWIVVSTMFQSFKDYSRLVEYLAGPSDSPYGGKRAAWGRKQPWTAAFKRIYLELGNETWNGMFAPQGFSGKPEEYGAFAELVFNSMKHSPHFQPDKFKFVLNGWVAGTNRKWGYGPRAFENAPIADAVDIAYYLGGWDAVGLMKAEKEQSGWLNILTYYTRMLAPRAAEFKKVIDEIAAERGRAVQPLVYEAGPGYTLPGPGKFNIKEQEEGKSMAQAVNTLDSFMNNLRMGYGEQAFFIFQNGHYWSSHNRTWGEHIAWKALKMRNTLLEGDLVTATAKDMVSMDLPEAQADTVSQSNSADRRVRKFPALPNVPLVQCFPFKQGKRYSLMLFSRRLDGPTPVTVQVPYDPSPEVKVYRLGASSPAAHNIEREVVTVQEETRRDFAKTYTVQLPPYSVMVLVNQAK